MEEDELELALAQAIMQLYLVSLEPTLINYVGSKLSKFDNGAIVGSMLDKYGIFHEIYRSKAPQGKEVATQHYTIQQLAQLVSELNS